MNDSDLSVTCVCGCVEIVKRGGYEICTLGDARELGQAASELCRHKRRRKRWIRWGVIALIVLIATAGTMGIMEMKEQKALGKASVKTMLCLGFVEWRECRYDDALKWIDQALEVDPANIYAQRARRMVMDAGGRDSRVSIRP